MKAVETRPATHSHFFAFALVNVSPLRQPLGLPLLQRAWNYTKLISKMRVFFQIEEKRIFLVSFLSIGTDSIRASHEISGVILNENGVLHLDSQHSF
jgi:hypothetical protein